MAWNEAVVTNEGIRLLSECVSDGNVIITRAEGGEQYSNPLSLIAQKEIKAPRHLLNIAYIRTENGIITVNVRMQNSGVEAPYYIKQIGLFAKSDKSEEEILFALIQDKDGEVIPASEENPEYLSEFDFVIPVSNAENISINVTPDTFVTFDDISGFADHIKDNDRHIAAAERTAWNGKAAGNHTHSAATQSAAGFMSAADKKKLDGVAAGANAYTHPTASGNKHIPSGGASGQILRWSADGTAAWGADSNTTYSAMTGASASAAGTTGLVPAPAKGKQTSFLRGDGTWAIPADTTYAAMTGATASAAGGAGLVPAPAKGAQAKYLRGDGTWQIPTDTTYSAATQSAAGLMSAEDKKKLDGVAASANNYSLPAASASVRGGAKIGYTANGKNYPVQLSNEQMFVNVPWTDTNTTYSNMTGASASAAGTAGLVPAPAAGKQTSFLRGDGTWAIPTNTTYSNMTGASASAAGVAGLVPAPAKGAQAKYLRGDGTWQTPPDTNTTYSAATQSAAGLMSAEDKKKLDGVAASANNYSLPAASASARGGVKIGYTANGKNYPVQLSNEQMFVNVPWTDNNTTYSNMTGASASAAGGAGLVPAPAAGKQTSFLRGDGTWVIPTNTTYSAMTGASASAAGGAGLVPAPAAGKQTSFLRGDGTWVVPTNTTYSNMTGASASAAGKAGLVPAPAKGAQNYALRGNGTWGPCIGITRIVEASLSESTSSSVFSTTVPGDASYFQVIISVVVDSSFSVSYALSSPLLSCANNTKYKMDCSRIVGNSYGLLYIARSGKKEKATYVSIEVKSGNLTVSGSYLDYTTPVDGYPIIGSGTVSVCFL